MFVQVAEVRQCSCRVARFWSVPPSDVVAGGAVPRVSCDPGPGQERDGAGTNAGDVVHDGRHQEETANTGTEGEIVAGLSVSSPSQPP